MSSKDGDHELQTALTVIPPAWSGASGRREGIEIPHGSTANAESPKDQVENDYDPEKEWSELREDMEREDGPRAGMGMDDAEEVLPEEHCQEAGGKKTVLGKIQMTDHHMTTSGSQKKILRQGRGGACHLDAAKLGPCR